MCRSAATALITVLTRPLRLIAELPDRRTLPLLPQRSSKQSQFTSAQLLKAVEPLANALNPIRNNLDSDTTITTIAPEGYDTDVYVRILRWLLNDDEHLLASYRNPASDGLKQPSDHGFYCFRSKNGHIMELTETGKENRCRL